MYDIRSGYLQDATIHSSPNTRKDDGVHRCIQPHSGVSSFGCDSQAAFQYDIATEALPASLQPFCRLNSQ